MTATFDNVLLTFLRELLTLIQDKGKLELLRILMQLSPLSEEIKGKVSWLIDQIEAVEDPNIQASAEALLVSTIRAELKKVGINV